MPARVVFDYCDFAQKPLKNSVVIYMPWTIKTTFAFSGQQQGWSETFYWASNDGNLFNAEALVTPLAQKRAKLLASTYSLDVVRNVVIVDNTGAKVLRQSDLFEPRLAGVQAWAPATPNLAMLCAWQTADNKQQKKQYLRGIPAGLGDLGKIPDLNTAGAPSFASNFDAWRAAVIAFGAGWLVGVVSKTGVIQTYAVDPDTAQVTFTLSTPGIVPWPVSFGAPTRVYVSLPGKSPLDGPLVVVPTSATSCFTSRAHPAPPFPAGQIGLMKLRTPTLATLLPLNGQGNPGQIHPQRIISHKTGRPTYASRGRAPARIVW